MTEPAATPRRGGGAADGAAEVLLDFQVVMRQFLELQRAMLATYLDAQPLDVQPGRPSAAADLTSPATVPLPVVSASDQSAADSSGPLDPSLSTQASPPFSPPPPLPPDTSSALSEPSSCARYRLVVTGRPLGGARAPLARDHVIAITDDGRGVAARMGERLRADGYRAVTLSTAEAEHGSGAQLAVPPLETVADADRLVALVVERFGPIAALVHLAPLAPPAVAGDQALDAGELWRTLCRDTKTLFLLAKAMEAELARAARQGGAALIACTALGGDLGQTAAGVRAPHRWAGQGGVLGLTKCLALEWPDVRVRAVDLDPAEPADTLAGHVLDELWAPDRGAEVGYAHGARVGLEIAAAPVTVGSDFDLPSDAVVLVTGGARGITADVCLELAARYQPTFVIVGQSARPEGYESPDTAGLSTPADIKRALMNRLQASGERVSPAAVETRYRRLEKEREIRRNLGALIATGARLHYVALDVGDAGALGALVDDIYATYGRLDGVIHGAGIIEDKLVRDKPLESFERVFRTKALSAVVLSRHLRPESLRFLVLFASVAGRFGNRGQADYAAANETVSKLATALSHQWPGRVCSIAWAPWDGRGMVSAELRREFMRRGVALVPPAAGARACWMELQQAGGADAEIVVAGDPTLTAEPDRAAAPPGADALPLLGGARCERAASGTASFSRSLDVAIDRYLDDHRIDGIPVLPFAVATELMAEAAQAIRPDLTVVAVRHLRLFKGILVPGPPVPVVITARPSAGGDDDPIEVDVELSTPGLTPAVRYRGVVQLASQLPAPPAFVPRTAALAPLPLTLGRAYREWTFHGPMFQRVTRIAGIDGEGLAGSLFSWTGVPVLSTVARPQWIVDPFAVDAALQLVLIWSRAVNGLTALPSRFQAFHRYGPLSDRALTCHLAVESAAGGHWLKNDIAFVDADGRLVGRLEGLEASCSAALNRVAARPAASDAPDDEAA